MVLLLSPLTIVVEGTDDDDDDDAALGVDLSAVSVSLRRFSAGESLYPPR